jgi:serine/threonine protein kinase
MNKLWKQITPSDFAWEREALDYLRGELPDHEPYRAWSNFEFIAQDGSINEVDLLVLTPKGLFLVEIKSHPGEISGDAGSWVWSHEGRRRAFDNPRLLTDRKAKKLASLLKSQRSAIRERERRIPFINTLVFLSAENVINKLQGPARKQVCTRTNVRDELTQMDEFWNHKRLDKRDSRLLSRCLEEAGIKESLRSHRVGLHQLRELLDETDHFQDWRAEHGETGMQRRIRIYLTQGRPAEEAEVLQRGARLEFRLLEGIQHPGILHALDLQEHDQGPALIYEYDPAAQRLDHYITGLGDDHRLDILDALALMRGIAEAVRYAHAQRLYHRALNPQCIYLTHPDTENYQIKIGHWATADRSFENETRHLTVLSHLSLMAHEAGSPYLALEAHNAANSDAVYLDIFSLGAIAYLLFSGQPPAANELELQDKLSRGMGLQVTDAINGAGQELQDLIQYATHPDLGQRTDSVEEFLLRLDEVEEEITRPDNLRQSNPTEALPGDLLEGGIKIKQRLGRGASSVAFVVEHQQQIRVLKLAARIEHNNRLQAEGEILHKLRHQGIIAHHQTLQCGGHTGLLLDYASEGTLARRLRKEGAIQLELLERFGDDLLGALVHLEEKGIAHRDLKPENIGLVKQGSQLHLVLYDFSLANLPLDNITAGTLAYLDPFIRDPGRRRWDDYAERFAAALTLYEMATGTLPNWSGSEGMPPLIDGQLEIDASIFDPGVRDAMTHFFAKALARDVKQRFGNAYEMRNAWTALFTTLASQAQRATRHPEPRATCPVEEAQPDTQIGLLPLSPQALDTLSRLNINRVAELIALPRNQLVRMTGVGTRTRRELSELIGRLQQRLATPPEASTAPPGDGPLLSIDQLFALISPKPTKASDPTRLAFVNEYLGRLDQEPPNGHHQVHWPILIRLATQIGIDTAAARDLQARVLANWGKNKQITQLRQDIAQLLDDNGGLMTAMELAEAALLRRGSVQGSPRRQRIAQAVIRAAVETELSRQQPRWTLRRAGNRILIADNSHERGEELADYAEALGQIADECARQQPLLSPIRALERIRAVPAPESFAGLSNHRLLRLAVAASQHAALSSRAEFYPRDMAAERSLELAQGALLGARALSVAEVQARIHGRYPEAQPLPGRPQLDDLMQRLELGFQWDGNFQRDNQRGAYCLPQTGLTSYTTRASTRASTRYRTQHDDADPASRRELEQFTALLTTSLNQGRFLALSVRPRHWRLAQQRLAQAHGLNIISFDQRLFHHLHRICDAMAKPPRWELVLQADAAPPASVDRGRLHSLIQRALPAITEEIKKSHHPLLLTDPGLIARYGLVDTWLAHLRNHLAENPDAQALLLLTASDTSAPAIDDVTIPSGAGSREFIAIPAAWLRGGEDQTPSEAIQ